MRRRSGRRWWLRFVVLAVLLGAGFHVAYLTWTWPDAAALRHRPPATTAFIERYRAQQRVAGRPDRVAWIWVEYDRISPHLKRAVLVGEDINFFSHRGFDAGEVREAVREALEEGELPRGASTISQQLAKNLWLSPSRNPLRKAKEAVLTWQGPSPSSAPGPVPQGLVRARRQGSRPHCASEHHRQSLTRPEPLHSGAGERAPGSRRRDTGKTWPPRPARQGLWTS